ncbi:hypothetical protein [Bradyrhizobium sp. dw_78]|uniref:hypothetical protein n=1 Tax=Bradyrhizobium sp. dw_78 TaxID=2719793 RepID=UPI001BD531A4|nr:hypothetical protein [Bradyrhizobium sp. dw_78]
MLKYLSKFASDILPSVAATIIGAYIVNHYITAKPASDAPVAAAVSSADPKKAETSNLPEAGVRAKGISEKAIFDRSADKSATEKPTEKLAEKEKSAEKLSAEKSLAEKSSAEKSSAEKSSAEKLEDKPAETASIPADTHRHSPPTPREKTAIRTIPLTASPPAAQPAVSASAPAAAPSSPPPAVEVNATPEDHRDANDLARAAIERLRGMNENAPHAQEAVRAPVPEAPSRMVAAPQAPQIQIPQAQAPAVQPLPPPVMVSSPAGEAFGSGAGPGPQPQQSYPTAARIDDDPRRPTPPADIPSPQPLDLRADNATPLQRHNNVAEDMLSAAKSVFHAVLPQ